MSDSRSTSSSPSSSFEQGEVKSSPEVYKTIKVVKKEKRGREVVVVRSSSKERRATLSPHPHTSDTADKKPLEVIEIQSDDGEIERDALNIKPPQSQAGPVRREKTHKRKHKAERRREKQKNRDLDKERERYHHSMDRQGRADKYETKDRVTRPIKDAREIVRERQKEKEKRQKESLRDEWAGRDDRDSGKEARKRRESLKERERLENMEREKQRERRLREERERADKQRRKEEERRLQQRAEDIRPREKSSRNDRRMERSSERSTERSNRDRNRTNKEHRRQRGDRDRSDVREKERSRVKDEDERGRSRRSHTREQSSHSERREEERKPVTPEPAEDEEEDEEIEEEEEEEEVISEPPSPRGNVHSDDDERSDKSPEGKTNSSDDESHSGDKSSGSDSEKDFERHIRSKFEKETDDEHDKRSEGDSQSPLLDTPDIYDTPRDSEYARKEDLPVYLPAIQGCRNVEEFHCLNRIEEGTYGVVYRSKDRKTDEIVALKRLKMEKEKEGFPITSLREINTLLKAQHENIVHVKEIVVGSNMDKIYIVMEYVEHDLKSLMETMKNAFSIGEVKTLMIQLLRAVNHLHENWILHRDLKTSNLLLSHKGILKVGDFGLAREYGSPLKPYTPVVVTLWYRAPELLLGVKEYTTPIDMWSVGCIFAELLTLKALWNGKSEIDQLNKIFKDLGTPTEKIWEGVSKLPVFKSATFQNHPQNTIRERFGTHFSNLGFDLMNRLLTYDPKQRITAEAGMKHKWFKESPAPTDPSYFPTWPARSEMTHRRHASSPKPPSGGKAYAKLMMDEEALQAAGFHMDTAAKGASAQGAGFQLKFGVSM